MGFEQFRNRMIPPQKCAEELSVSEFTIHRWIRYEKIKAVKLSSRCTRIIGDSLAEYLEAGGADSKPPAKIGKVGGGVAAKMVASI